MLLVIKLNKKQCDGKLKRMKKGDKYICNWTLNDDYLNQSVRYFVSGFKTNSNIAHKLKQNNKNKDRDFGLRILEYFHNNRNFEISIRDFPSYLNGVELILYVNSTKYNPKSKYYKISLNKFEVGNYFHKKFIKLL